ncbi:unnamed protein product [Owenia fusiformis]|uniref:Uncharacterized protein n=1 Tax=Owenia fusiformis TaxID=6347 RepID=A0A8J1UJF7_OWEFU|nr:unnamed protein product [Owenia fusiformis]
MVNNCETRATSILLIMLGLANIYVLTYSYTIKLFRFISHFGKFNSFWGITRLNGFNETTQRHLQLAINNLSWINKESSKFVKWQIPQSNTHFIKTPHFEHFKKEITRL